MAAALPPAARPDVGGSSAGSTGAGGGDGSGWSWSRRMWWRVTVADARDAEVAVRFSSASHQRARSSARQRPGESAMVFDTEGGLCWRGDGGPSSVAAWCLLPTAASPTRPTESAISSNFVRASSTNSSRLARASCKKRGRAKAIVEEIAHRPGGLAFGRKKMRLPPESERQCVAGGCGLAAGWPQGWPSGWWLWPLCDWSS